MICYQQSYQQTNKKNTRDFQQKITVLSITYQQSYQQSIKNLIFSYDSLIFSYDFIIDNLMNYLPTVLSITHQQSYQQPINSLVNYLSRDFNNFSR